MKKTNIVITFSTFIVLLLFIGGCVVAPPYDDRGYYSSAPNVVIHDPPLFLYPPSVGFWAAIGIPYDLFYFDRYYYLHDGGRWYRSHHYNGPWGTTKYKTLPKSFRNRSYKDIVRERDREYRSYQKKRDRYQGRYFRPDRYESPRRDRNSYDRYKRR